MTINEMKSRLGAVENIEIAQASISKSEALEKITKEIEKKGLDVDEAYLDFLRSLEYSSVEVTVQYIPLYYVTAVAKLSWKERKEGEDPTDHQEFVKFNTLFYAHQNDHKDRINKLDILKVLDKKAANIKETPVECVNDDVKYEVSLVEDKNETYLPQVIMDVPLREGEYYPLDSNYVMSSPEIESEIQKALEKTKSYHRLSKQSEKWSSIEHASINVVVVPVASLKVGEHDQLVNCSNGITDICYEKSKIITGELKKARFLVFPSIILLGVMLITTMIMMLVMKNQPVVFENISFKPLQSFNGWIWLISFVLGAIFALIAIPSRKGIVRRATANKNTITVCKIFALMIYAIDYSLVILMLMILQNLIAK